jgi:hypothetical protein
MTITQLRLVNPNGTTTCCGAFTSIFIDDEVEYCKACFNAVDGHTPVDLSHNTRIKIASTQALDGQPISVYEYLVGGPRYEVFVGGWRVTTVKTRAGALRRAALEETR